MKGRQPVAVLPNRSRTVVLGTRCFRVSAVCMNVGCVMAWLDYVARETRRADTDPVAVPARLVQSRLAEQSPDRSNDIEPCRVHPSHMHHDNGAAAGGQKQKVGG